MKSVPLEVTMMKRIGELNKENARLKAEVERLAKAGDAMSEWFFDSDLLVENWNAAKEGKPGA